MIRIMHFVTKDSFRLYRISSFSDRSNSSICGSQQRRQFGLKTGGSWIRVWKRGGSWVLNVQQTEACSTGLGYFLRNYYLIYTNLFYFWKVTPLESVLISYSCMGYNNISWRPHESHPKIRGPKPPGLTHRQLRVKDLPKVSTWRLEWGSNQWPCWRKAKN